MNDQEFKSRAQVARQLLNERRLEEALIHARSLVADYPDKPQPVMLNAEVHKARKEDEEAILVLEGGLTRHPRNLKLLTLARNLAFECGKYEEAAYRGGEIASLAPADYRNRTFFIQLHLRMNRAEAALEESSELIDDFPDLSLPVILKSQASFALNEPERGFALLREALRRFGHDTDFLSSARYLAFRHGGFDEAMIYADRMAEVTPGDPNNEVFLTKFDFASGRFAAAAARAEELCRRFPHDPQGQILKAQALVAQHKVADGLETLARAAETHAQDQELLAVGRAIAFQNARFEEAASYAQRLQALGVSDAKNDEALAQSLMASGQVDAVEEYLGAIRRSSDANLRKARGHFEEYKRLRAEFPVLVETWGKAVANKERAAGNAILDPPVKTTMIQYWSQEQIPQDVRMVSNVWSDLVAREGLGELAVFDHWSAKRWIAQHAPEFSESFSNCFHFAMESDVFRVAYASRNPCIYMDIDSWPLENTAPIIRHAVQGRKTMLYMRVYRPWIVNGFFVAQPESRFMKELVRQCLDLDLGTMPKNHDTIECTFGPGRYNKVVLDLIKAAGTASSQPVPGVFGCSALSLDDEELLFSHEAAVASVRPPFTLKYKNTKDYWKGLSING